MFDPRIESDAAAAFTATPLALPVLPVVPDDEIETPPLPRDHPKWVKDALAVSYRARRLLARVRPVAIRVLTFWDHQLRGVSIAGSRLTVDFSGSYKLDW